MNLPVLCLSFRQLELKVLLRPFGVIADSMFNFFMLEYISIIKYNRL